MIVQRHTAISSRAWSAIQRRVDLSLCVIIPRVPPAIDGIGDYCHQLWRALGAEPEERAGRPLSQGAEPVAAGESPLNWSFIVMDGGEASRQLFGDTRIAQC